MNDVAAPHTWLEANQRYLCTAFARISALLQRPQSAERVREADDAIQAARAALPAPGAMDALVETFALTPFERDIVLLLAAAEMDTRHVTAVEAAITFRLALSALPEPHWSALTPEAPLRRWRLVELGPGSTLAGRPLRLDERVLHFLAGMPAGDSLLEGHAQRHVCASLDAKHRAWVERILEEARRDEGAFPLIELCAETAAEACDVAAAAAAALDLKLFVLHGDDLPPSAPDRTHMGNLWQRDAALARAALLLDCRECATPERAVAWAGSLEVPVFVSTSSATALPVSASRLTLGTHAARTLESLADRVPVAATWDDLVVPPAVGAALRMIAQQARLRSVVEGRWGMARGGRPSGIAALLCGGSGTGKTLAAEVLAAELGVPLYRIDLASVVSKYIGETERNLKRVFDAAEGTDAILLFDEADALFGKRSDVRDSHDRYANIEVSYLLQRIEAHGGICLLTTNARSAIDRAFVRRLRFIVEFPFPDARLRERIWRQAFPRAVPVADLDYARLSRLEASGGDIRNIALNAAYVAAAAGEPITMKALAAAARGEFAKRERNLSDLEFRDWT
jgi:hypothetical protein